MKYARLGDSGLVVSRLTLGAMTFGTKGNAAIAKVDAAAADRLCARAREAGVTLFDTADVYTGGESEILLGKALKPYRGEIMISTKVGSKAGRLLTQSGLSAHHIHQSVEASLQRLGTDWIDLYIAHRPDPLTPLEETLLAFDALVRSGKVRYLGFSNWPAWLAAKAIELQKAHGWARFVTGQMYYSLLGRDVEHEVVPCAQAQGFGLMAWSPLASGYLSGKYGAEAAGDDRLATYQPLIPIDRGRGAPIVDTLKAIAGGRGVTPASVALAWLMARPAVSTIVVGVTKPAQLEDNLAAAGLELDAGEIAALDAASATPLPYPKWFLGRVFDDPVQRAVEPHVRL